MCKGNLAAKSVGGVSHHVIVLRADPNVGPNEDKRTYSLPTANEVAVLIENEAKKRDILVTLRPISIEKNPLGLQRISETHQDYLALSYPLIFINGESSWHLKLRFMKPAATSLGRAMITSGRGGHSGAHGGRESDSVPPSDVPTSQMGRSTTPCGTLHNLSGKKKKDYSPAVGRV